MKFLCRISRVLVWTAAVAALTLNGVVVRVTASQSNCGLPCQNGGVCHTRRLESTITTQQQQYEENRLQHAAARLLLQQPKQYCQCPVGYTGVLCEVKYVLCSNEEDTCFSGKPCQREVDGFGSEFFRCECDVSNSDLSIPRSAKFCEHESTVFCNMDAGKKQDRQRPVSEMAKGSFCKNGGRCKDKNTSADPSLHHNGCECKTGFSGAYCEINNNPQIPQKVSSLLASSTSLTSATKPHRRWFRALVAFVLILLAFFAMGMAILIRMENQRQGPSRKKRQSAQERARIPKERRPISNEIELT